MTSQFRFSSAMLVVVWVSSLAAVTGFLLPWVKVQVEDLPGRVTHVTHGTPLEGLAGALTTHVKRVVVKVKQGTEVVTGELPDLSAIPEQIRGVDLPRLANRQDMQVVLFLAETLTGSQAIATKSYLVYLLPGLALLCGVLLTVARQVRAVCVVTALLCLGVAGVGFWKLLAISGKTMVLTVTVGPGLWVSLWAYVGVGLAALGLAWLARSRRATA